VADLEHVVECILLVVWAAVPPLPVATQGRRSRPRTGRSALYLLRVDVDPLHALMICLPPAVIPFAARLGAPNRIVKRRVGYAISVPHDLHGGKQQDSCGASKPTTQQEPK
jgi:hypothetical protein